MPRFQNHQGDRTFYCPEAATGADVALDAAEAGHAVRVLRLGAGDAVTLFDGRGRFYDAVIARADKRSAVVRVGAARESQADPRARVVLLVGYLKGPKTDFLIQKCVELGVAELVFFAAERSVARPRLRADEVSGGAGAPLALSCGAGVSPANASVAGQRPAPQRFAGGTPAPQDRAAEMDPRHLSIVVSACKQCGRASLMPVVVCGSLQAALARLPDDGLERIVYWEEASPDASRSPIEHRDVSLVSGQAFVVPASAGNPLDATGGVAGNLTGAETGNAFSAEAGTTNVGADEAEGMSTFPAEAGTTNVGADEGEGMNAFPAEARTTTAFPAEAGPTNVVPPEGGPTYFSADSRATCAISRGAFALIGPEGGLTAAEVARARQAGFAVRSLGRRILRAETAALAAAALLLHEAGELG